MSERELTSAKALFRATKRKAPAPVLFGAGELPTRRRPEDRRRALDFYPTAEPEAVRALLAADGARIAGLGAVWEPAAGRGDLVRELAAAGLTCVASDIADHGCPDLRLCSFYDFAAAPAPAIVTNPPYCEINARDGHGRWLRHTLDLPEWRYCALLLGWDWPAAVANGLGALLDVHPFAWCYLLRWKLDFTGGGSPPQRNAWFVWDRDHRGPPEFRWLGRADGRQGTLTGVPAGRQRQGAAA